MLNQAPIEVWGRGVQSELFELCSCIADVTFVRCNMIKWCVKVHIFLCEICHHRTFSVLLYI